MIIKSIELSGIFFNASRQSPCIIVEDVVIFSCNIVIMKQQLYFMIIIINHFLIYISIFTILQEISRIGWTITADI